MARVPAARRGHHPGRVLPEPRHPAVYASRRGFPVDRIAVRPARPARIRQRDSAHARTELSSAKTLVCQVAQAVSSSTWIPANVQVPHARRRINPATSTPTAAPATVGVAPASHAWARSAGSSGASIRCGIRRTVATVGMCALLHSRVSTVSVGAYRTGSPARTTRNAARIIAQREFLRAIKKCDYGGACVHACELVFSCCNGVCLDTRWDPARLGGCGEFCAAGQICNVGFCVFP